MDEKTPLYRHLLLSASEIKQNGTVPAPRVFGKVISKANKFYLFGGANEEEIFDDLHVLEIEKLEWKKVEAVGFTLPCARIGHTFTLYDQSIILFGGFLPVMAETSKALEHSRLLNPLWFFSKTFTTELYNGTLLNDMFLLNINKFTWVTPEMKGAIPPPRCFHTGSVLHTNETSYFIVFGGAVDTSFSKGSADVWIMDLKTFFWKELEQLGSIPTPRYGHEICSVDNKFYLLGGANDGGKLYFTEAKPDIFKNPQITWTTVENAAGTPPLSRSFHSLCNVSDRLMVFGGRTILPMVSDLSCFLHKENRWSVPFYDGRIELRGHAASGVFDKLLVFGGARPRISEGDVFGNIDEDRFGERIKSIMAPVNSYRCSNSLSVLSVMTLRPSTSNVSDSTIKVIAVGDSGVGKSCLMKRFATDVFNENHTATIGLEFDSVRTMVRGKLVTVQLWDTAGQERFGKVAAAYYRKAHGFIVVYDATCRSSFERIDVWLREIKEHHEISCSDILMLVGNKYDMIERVEVSEEEGKKKAADISAIFVPTSAKTAANVDSAFIKLIHQVLDHRLGIDEMISRTRTKSSTTVLSTDQKVSGISLDATNSIAQDACCST